VTRLSTILFFITLVVGCQRAPAETTQTGAAGQPASPRRPRAGSSPGGGSGQSRSAHRCPGSDGETAARRVARRGRAGQRRADREGRIRARRAGVRSKGRTACPCERRDEVYRGVLDQLVSLHVLIQESRSRKIQVSDPEVDARIAEVKKQFPSERSSRRPSVSST